MQAANEANIKPLTCILYIRGGNIYNFDLLRLRFRSIAVTLTPENKRREWKVTFECSYIPRS